MSNVAELGVKIVGQGVREITKDLNDAAASAARTETAVQSLATSDRVLVTSLTAIIAELQRANTGLSALAAIETRTAQATASMSAAMDKLGQATRQPREETDKLAASVAALREKFNPLIAISAQYQAALKQIAAAEKEGGLSAREAAQHRMTAATAADQAAANLQKGADRRRIDYQNLGFQANDVVTMGLTGASPFQIAASQGGQIFQSLQMAEGGVTGGLRTIREDLMSASKSAAEFLGPGGIILTGLTAAALAVAYFGDHTERNFKRVADAAKSYGDAIQELRRGHELLGQGADAVFNSQSAMSPAGLAARAAAELETQRRAAEAAKEQAPVTALGALPSYRPDVIARDLARRVAGEYSAKNLIDLSQEFEAGSKNAEQFRTELNRVASDTALPDYLRETVVQLLELADGAVKAGAATEALQRGLEVARRTAAATRYDAARENLNAFLPNDLTNRDQIERAYREEMGRIQQTRGIKGDERQDLEADAMRRRTVALAEIDRQEANIRTGHRLDLADIVAKNAEDLRQNAILRERAALEGDTTIGAVEKDRRAQEAGEVAYARAVYASNEALRQRSLSMQQMLDDLDLEVRRVGGVIGAAERARIAYQLMAQAKEAAYAEGREVSDAEVAAINATADAVGKATVRLQAMRTEQDLLFERSQLFRSATESQVAEATRGFAAGSDEANRIADLVRGNERLKEIKEDIHGLFDGLGSDLLNSSKIGDVFENIAGRIQQVAGKQLDRMFETAADSVFSSIFQSPEAAKLKGIDMPIAKDLLGTTSATAMWVRSADAMPYAGGSQGGALGAVNALGQGGRSANDNLGMVAYRDAIASIESRGSGGYGAVGPITRSGDRAYGRYQIMGANIGEWSEAALGQRLTTAQFMANPAYQDRIFDHRFGGYVDKYGASGAAQAWFGGPGSVGGSGSGKDMLGTSGSAYVSKFNASLESSTSAIAGTASQFQNNFASTLNDGLIGGMGQTVDQFVPGLGGVLQNVLNAFRQPGGGGGIGGLISNLFGGGGSVFDTPESIMAAANAPGMFATGGFTGFGGRYEPAGVVHRGEFVMSAPATSALGVGFLDALHRSGMRGYDAGGYVGDRLHVPANANMPMAGSQAPSVSFSIVNNGRPADIESRRETTDENGNRMIEVQLREIVQDETLTPHRKTARGLRQRGVAPQVMQR